MGVNKVHGIALVKTPNLMKDAGEKGSTGKRQSKTAWE
jgi:hypothetical protein